MAQIVHIRFTVFSNFSKFLFVLHIDFFEISPMVMRIIVHGAHGVYKIYSVFKLFEVPVCSAHWLFRNFSYGDAHHANYGKLTLNHHFRHGAHSVYKIYSVLKLFGFAVCFGHFGFFEISTPVMRIMLTMANIV